MAKAPRFINDLIRVCNLPLDAALRGRSRSIHPEADSSLLARRLAAGIAPIAGIRRGSAPPRAVRDGENVADRPIAVIEWRSANARQPAIDPSRIGWFLVAMRMTDDFLPTGRKIAATAAFAAMAILGVWSIAFPRKPIPLNSADGLYVNSQCGAVSFKNGVVSWGTAKASYTLESDKIGIFALTNYLIGISTSGSHCFVSSDQLKYPLKLRFDSSQHPATVTLWNLDQPATVDFSRLSARTNGS